MSGAHELVADAEPAITGPKDLAESGPLLVAAFAAWYWAKLVGSIQRVAEDARKWFAAEAILRASAIEHHERVKQHIAAQAEHQDEVVRLLDEKATAGRARA